MKNIKKTIAVVLAILLIIVFSRFSLAATLGNNTTDDNTVDNSSEENTSDNSITNNSSSSNSLSNSSSSNSVKNSSSSNISNTSKPINTSNSSENLPNTGIEDTYFNFALILLLAVCLGMFSLVQYRKIINKEN